MPPAPPLQVQGLLHEVEVALREGLPDDVSPLAVFDADGTLWDDDIGLAAFTRQAEAGLLRPEVVRGPLREWASEYGLALDEDEAGERLHARILEAIASGELVAHGLARGHPEDETLADLYAMHAWCYAGCAVVDVEAHGAAVWESQVKARVFDVALPLLEGLAGLGVRTVMISASPELVLRAAALDLGLPPGRVFGIMPVVEEGRVTPRVVRVVHGPGKAEVLDMELGGDEHRRVRPLLAFGDSPGGGDRELLARAHRPVVVAPQGRHLAAAEAAGYPVLWPGEAERS